MKNETHSEADKKAMAFFNPKMILGMLPMLIPFLPMILTAWADKIKAQDADTVGSDDAFANVLVALAPAAAAFGSKDDLSFKKALEAVYTTLGNYLGKTPTA